MNLCPGIWIPLDDTVFCMLVKSEEFSKGEGSGGGGRQGGGLLLEKGN